MSTSRHIAILCNNRMAMPAIQALYAAGQLCALGVPESNTDIIDFCKALSSQAGIPLTLFGKANLKEQLEELLKKSSPDFVFTMTFPWKVPTTIWQSHPNKFYNFHYGLLPEMRGSDPVFESIRQQKQETGITVHAINSGIDKGAIIMKQVLPVETNITHGLLCTHLSYLGARMLQPLMEMLKTGTAGTSQDEATAHYYQRPGSSEVCIRWETQDAKSIQALVQACNPWNKGAYTQWNGWHIRIVEASVSEQTLNSAAVPGTVLSIDTQQGLFVQCKDNTQLKINIIYTDEGFMSGHRLTAFGVKKDELFTNL
jgi:methionyl-tRNA formyltransferase